MPASSADPSSAAVVLRAVDVRYAPSTAGGAAVDALLDVTLRVERGERVALLGASGAGKSTLLDLVAGLVPPAAGSVEVLGTSLESLGGRPFRRHRSRVGVVRQQHGLPPSMRVVHNVNAGRLGRWSTGRALASLVVPLGRTEVEAALAQVDLAGVTDRRTGDPSGGQQQRVAVARILLQEPELILADERVSAVDPRLSTDVVTVLCDRSSPRCVAGRRSSACTTPISHAVTSTASWGSLPAGSGSTSGLRVIFRPHEGGKSHANGDGAGKTALTDRRGQSSGEWNTVPIRCQVKPPADRHRMLDPP